MERADIIERLRYGVTKFRYRKRDGTLRTAYGTLDDDLIPETRDTDAWRRTGPSGGPVPYYDIASRGWRSFYPDTFETCPEYGT